MATSIKPKKLLYVKPTFGFSELAALVFFILGFIFLWALNTGDCCPENVTSDWIHDNLGATIGSLVLFLLFVCMGALILRYAKRNKRVEVVIDNGELVYYRNSKKEASIKLDDVSEITVGEIHYSIWVIWIYSYISVLPKKSSLGKPLKISIPGQIDLEGTAEFISKRLADEGFRGLPVRVHH